MFDLENGFKYDFWANQVVLEQLRRFDIPQANDLLAHCCAAQKVWLSRINGNPLQLNSISLNKTLKEIKSQFDGLNSEFLILCSQKEQLLEPISYSNSKGEKFENTLSDILFHVVIHGQHHRAQIATLICQFGETPKPTDYIFYIRTKTSTEKLK